MTNTHGIPSPETRAERLDQLKQYRAWLDAEAADTALAYAAELSTLALQHADSLAEIGRERDEYRSKWQSIMEQERSARGIYLMDTQNLRAERDTLARQLEEAVRVLEPVVDVLDAFGALSDALMDPNAWRRNGAGPKLAAARAFLDQMKGGGIAGASGDGAESVAARDVLAERRRQVDRGFDADHDDQHDGGEIISDPTWGAKARLQAVVEDRHPNPRHALVEAAAQILAEIERRDRAALTDGGAS